MTEVILKLTCYLDTVIRQTAMSNYFQLVFRSHFSCQPAAILSSSLTLPSLAVLGIAIDSRPERFISVPARFIDTLFVAGRGESARFRGKLARGHAATTDATERIYSTTIARG